MAPAKPPASPAGSGEAGSAPPVAALPEEVRLLSQLSPWVPSAFQLLGRPLPGVVVLPAGWGLEPLPWFVFAGLPLLAV